MIILHKLKKFGNQYGFFNATLGVFTILFLLGCSKLCFAQDATGKHNDEIVCELPVIGAIHVRVTVVNLVGKSVSGLQFEDFAVYENKVRQSVIAFTEKEIVITGRRKSVYELSYYPLNHRYDESNRTIRIEAASPKRQKLRCIYSPRKYIAKYPGRN